MSDGDTVAMRLAMRIAQLEIDKATLEDLNEKLRSEREKLLREKSDLLNALAAMDERINSLEAGNGSNLPTSSIPTAELYSERT